MTLGLSMHASKRIRQRGLREKDIALVMACARDLGDGCLFLTKEDANREIARRKREIQMLERLQGCKVVMGEDRVVTAYRATRKNQRRIIHDAY